MPHLCIEFVLPAAVMFSGLNYSPFQRFADFLNLNVTNMSKHILAEFSGSKKRIQQSHLILNARILRSKIEKTPTHKKIGE